MKIKIYETLKRKLLESARSVLPITLVVLLLSFVYVPMPLDVAMKFIIGSALLIAGLALFTLGVDVAMTPIGDMIGSYLGKKNKLWLLLVMGIIVGFIITITEPGLQLLAELTTDIPSLILIVTVAIGVGLFLAIAFWRKHLNIKLNYILFGLYGFLFIFAFFIPKDFLSIAFDSGGITMGEMTVPFIMAIGVGIASVQKGKISKEDNFGLIGICSIGPIITVMMLGLIYNPNSNDSYVGNAVALTSYYNTTSLGIIYFNALIDSLVQMLMALAPIVVFFIIFALMVLKISSKKLIHILKGMLYALIGLVLFLTGAKTGFLPAGNALGYFLASSEFNWILVISGMIFGYFVISAEPAIYVLNKQVAEITRGEISQKAMGLSLSIGVAFSVGIAMVRIITGLPILWILLPGYAISLGLTFFVPKMFTAIAFDAGGVASGPLGSSFLLPLAIGASSAVGGNILTDAFGIMAMVAMTPLITIQIMGVYFKISENKKKTAKTIE